MARFDWAARSARTVSTSLRPFWQGCWSLLRPERFSDDHIGLGSRKVVSYLNCSSFETFSFCLEVG